MFLLDIVFWALSFSTLSVMQGDNTRAEDPDEQGLLERASKADPEALAVLYDRYVGRIYNYIYHRVGQADLAEDLTAQVFARMLESIRDGRACRTSFSGWIYRIAHNLVIDHYRRRGRAAFVELDEATPIAADEADPLRKVEARLESEHLRAALTKLTEEQAEVIALRFLDEFSIAEVAAMMNKTEGAIKALQYRAVSALRRVMQPA
jgi:RNA polymerase sigma-70 factor (ECF subfamily)